MGWFGGGSSAAPPPKSGGVQFDDSNAYHEMHAGWHGSGVVGNRRGHADTPKPDGGCIRAGVLPNRARQVLREVCHETVDVAKWRREQVSHQLLRQVSGGTRYHIAGGRDFTRGQALSERPDDCT